MSYVQQKDFSGAAFNTGTRQYTDGGQTVNAQVVVPVDATGADLAASGVPDNQSVGVKSRIIGQDVWACGFVSAIASGIDTAYFTQRAAGTGVSVSQSSGNLLVVAGTTANAEYLARSTVAWRGSWIAKYKLTASTRVANSNFAVMLADMIGEGLTCTINSATSITIAKTAHGLTSANVGQYMFVGGISGAAGVPGRYAIASIPDANSITFTVAGWPASGSCTVDLFGHTYARVLYNGTTATNAAFDCQRRGYNSGDTTATILTTASGHVGQIVNDGGAVYYADMATTSSTTPQMTTRASRIENLPDDNTDLYLYLWSYNGTTAPSACTWTVGMVRVERFPNLPVFVAGNKFFGTQAPAPVQVTSGTITTVSTLSAISAGTNLIADVGIQYRASATGAATIKHIVSAASNNATNVKASAGRVVGWSFVNTTATIQYVKLHNSASAPTAGSGVVMTIAIPANGVNNMPLGGGGIGFSTGIGYTIVTDAADTGTTATTANAVIGDLFYA